MIMDNNGSSTNEIYCKYHTTFWTQYGFLHKIIYFMYILAKIMLNHLDVFAAMVEYGNFIYIYIIKNTLTFGSIWVQGSGSDILNVCSCIRVPSHGEPLSYISLFREIGVSLPGLDSSYDSYSNCEFWNKRQPEIWGFKGQHPHRHRIKATETLLGLTYV